MVPSDTALRCLTASARLDPGKGAPGWNTGALTGRIEGCAWGACIEAASELLIPGEEDWFGGEVVFRSAMTLCKDDKASLDSDAEGGAGEEEWPVMPRVPWDAEG